MTEHEAESFLHWRGWTTPRERHAEYLAYHGGHCRQCFRGDWYDPPFMCGDCEEDAYEAEREAAVTAFWDELEYERDCAFEALCDGETT